MSSGNSNGGERQKGMWGGRKGREREGKGREGGREEEREEEGREGEEREGRDERRRERRKGREQVGEGRRRAARAVRAVDVARILGGPQPDLCPLPPHGEEGGSP